MRKSYWKLSLIVVAIGMISFLSSCLNNDDDYTPQPRTGLYILHGAPGVGNLDVFLNGEKVNDDALSYTNGGSVGNGIPPNMYTIAFKNAVDTGTTVASIQDSLRNGVSYNAVLYDTGSVVKVMLFPNTVKEGNGQSGGAFLRFLQLSPDLNGVTFRMNETPVSENRNFADVANDPQKAAYFSKSGGSYSFSAVDQSGNIIDKIENKTLKSGAGYTIYLDGIDSTKATTDSLAWQLRVKRTL